MLLLSKRLILLIFISLFVYSCEEVVNVNLKDCQPMIVVESYITNGTGPFYVKVTRSQSYFDRTGFNFVDNAIVYIGDSLRKEQLFSKGSGLYTTTRFRGNSGRSYILEVNSDDKVFSASVAIPPPVKIDTVYFERGYASNDSLVAFVQFNDPYGTDNFYRIKIKRNGSCDLKDYNLVSDVHSDGATLLAPVYHNNFAPGDTVIVELCNLECGTWKYFKAINEILQQGVNSQSPGNPPTNITGGALGNFGAWGKYTYSIIVPNN